MICPYCNQEAEFLSSKEFYGKSYGTNLYVCKSCDARVGCHKHTNKPLGTMANAELRTLRMHCHARVDAYWKSKMYNRSEVYRAIAKKMKIHRKKAHIGMFNEEQCRKLIGLVTRMELLK